MVIRGKQINVKFERLVNAEILHEVLEERASGKTHGNRFQLRLMPVISKAYRNNYLSVI